MNAEQGLAVAAIAVFVGPLLHVVLSPKGGSWWPAPGARCPFGPRLGWVVMVLMLGPIGWLMYMRARAKARGSERR